jgi:2-polyprenyl-3-methyl-5-hydroxy-6-metoxy-1,4-benzoquinol methylase
MNPPPIQYGEDYFFAQYKEQYGKTYLEDFPLLKEMGKRRIRQIRHLLGIGTERPRLLDIGCAYGPFLAAASEGGFSPFGIDPAEEAIRYVNEKLHISAFRGFFPSFGCLELRGAGSFDVVTLWYVIEHFENCRQVLEEARRILRAGGVLAFSTPSASGISWRKSVQKFMEKSPDDHFTLWNPRTCRKILAQYGFEVKKIVITGHHPERFPRIGPSAAHKGGGDLSVFSLDKRYFPIGGHL